MSRTIFTFGLALVLLGFLASTTLNMYHNIEMLRAENQKISEALSQLSSEYKTIIQERDTLRNQNAELLKKNEMLQQDYVAENQSRLKAESDVAVLQTALDNITKESQVTVPLVHSQTEQQSTQSEGAYFTTVIPLTTGFAILGLGMIVINHYRANKNRNKKIAQTRNFPQSIPRM